MQNTLTLMKGDKVVDGRNKSCDLFLLSFTWYWNTHFFQVANFNALKCTASNAIDNLIQYNVTMYSMRFSEALALTPKDFDFSHQSLFSPGTVQA